MIAVRYRYVFEDVDRHGNVRIYFWRRPGRKVRMLEAVGSPAFVTRYHELLAAGPEQHQEAPRLAPGGFAWLVNRYTHSADLAALDAATRRNRLLILGHCCEEPIAPGEALTFHGFPVDRMTTKTLRILRDRKAATPAAALNRVKALRALFKWAVANELAASNPARDLERPRSRTTGHRPWSLEDVATFEAHHPVGTMPRLALAIMLFTGMRRSDAAQLGRQHIRGGWISKPQHKNRVRSPHRIEIPLLPELAEIINATPAGNLTLVTNSRGDPFTVAGFGNWFRHCCRAAGLADVPSHGLRKAGATRAAERGATSQQLMAIFGWRSLAEAELYTRSAERKRLASDAMGLIVPTMPSGENKRPKKHSKFKAIK